MPPTDHSPHTPEGRVFRALVRHDGSASGEGLVLQADVERTAAGRLQLRYTMTGPLAGVRLPEPAEPERADELWRHTCFEAFLAGPDGYLEFNFAPSHRWAAYRFAGYRSGMTAADLPPPEIEVRQTSDRFELYACVDLSCAGLPNDSWAAGLTAVVEAADGAISYWALAHAPGKPDFHHPDSFVLDLPAPA